MVVEKAGEDRKKAKLKQMQIPDLFSYVTDDWAEYDIKVKYMKVRKESGLRAVLAVVSIGLMNIDDLEGSIDTELRPFIKELRAQCSGDVQHGMGQFLFLSVLSKVSTNTGMCTKGDELTKLLFLSTKWSHRME